MTWTMIWKSNCAKCCSGPGEPCVSTSVRAGSTKLRSDAKTTYDHLKRPHSERVLSIECPSCGASSGMPCISNAPRSIRPHRDRVIAVCRKVAQHCYRAPMAGATACGKPARSGGSGCDDSERWSDTQCAGCLARQPEIALHYARYCGTEFEANLGNSRMRDYLDDCALQWGADDWISLPNDKQLLVRKAFDNGRLAERKARLS